MNLKDVISELEGILVDDSFVSRIEAIYATGLPSDVKKIISISPDTVSYEDFPLLRGLSHEEIIDAPGDMSVDFVSLGLLPIFDVGDNDYITYDITENIWCKFNIVDEIKFGKAHSVIEYLV